jgi:RNA polymerase sigma-70 factor (ECF subfamily)
VFIVSSVGDQNRTNGGPNRFTTTHWSVVQAAGAESASGREALEKLCRAYWYPLYAYVRRQGHTPEDAQDLTQAFFAHFLERNAVSRARRERGRFRSFLLTSLQHFLAHEWEKARAAKRGGGICPLPWNELAAENRYQLESDPELSPDKAFDRRWALLLFQQALVRLHAEFTAAGKAETFDQLKGFLSEAADQHAYAGVAERLNMTPAAVAVAAHRLRKRYGELVREEIAHTVTSPREIEDEMRHLIALMGG